MFVLTIQVYIFFFQYYLGIVWDDEFGIYFVDMSRELNFNNDVLFFFIFADNLAVN